MEFTSTDLDCFIDTIYDDTFINNNGGMGSPDMFTLFFTLKRLNPKIVIESGVWNGLSTKLIRKTLGPDVKILCLDPRPIPSTGYVDNNENTTYYLGKDFVDFGLLDLKKYNPDEIFCFFDCHQNAMIRLLQSSKKNITHVLLNDNYPANCGSHFTIEHLKNNDTRNYKNTVDEKQIVLDSIEIYHIFPNIFPGQIKTGEGYFDCTSYFTNECTNTKYELFNADREKYRWNTYIKLKRISL